MSRYLNPAIRQLKDQQVKFAPREVRLKQMQRAESLLARIDTGRPYHYRELCEEITSFRPEMYPDLVLSGEEAAHDLRSFIEDLSDSADLTPETAGEKVFTVQDLSRKFNVSTKTVDRWRNRGLVSRRFRMGSRKRVGFLQSSVERFLETHAGEIERGSRFSQIGEDERREIITRARRLARYGGCPTEISRRIARRLGRSAETIRYTLRTWDEMHPESAVFPNANAPLSDEQRKEIYRSIKRGVSAGRLARQYCRTRSTIYRVATEVRAARLLEHPIGYIDSPEFQRPDADEFILAPPPAGERAPSRIKPPPGLPPYLASLYTTALLTRDEEVYYFRKMNYLKFRASRLRDGLTSGPPRASDMDQIEGFLDRADEVKNFLIRSNLRLVVSIAKRHIRPGANFFEMVSDGNMSLIRAIEKFDYSRGNKFSTYATWAVMKNFARSIPAEHTLLDRFRTGSDEVFQRSTDQRSDQFEQELVHRRQKQALRDILERLDGREQDIIRCRYGLEEGTEPLTLEQVGSRFGVTKERIRQLEARALKKLRKIAEEERLDVPGI